MNSLISVVCENKGLQVIEDGTEKPGIGRAKMYMRSLKEEQLKRCHSQS